jgi:predicted CXXCH cytochrome family protein
MHMYILLARSLTTATPNQHLNKLKYLLTKRIRPMEIKRLFLAFVVLLIAQVSSGQTILGSAHDFSDDTWNTTGEICIVCHTPHNADMTVSNAPLWNHQTTAVTNYDLYTSATFNGSSTIGQPDESSKLCLSCHDGTVALENFGTMTTGVNYIEGIYNLGNDLRDDHPISFIYDGNLTTIDGGLFDPTSTEVPELGGTIDEKMLFNQKLQCASCHDVHNSSGENYLLLFTNSASNLCLTCHNK